ncbi:MAG TPA: hypothetical protein VFB79_12605 [Candidatus Angelobacter sp.]|nr:hypothetical protein [Candidatus Angelobacter sp.]
MGGPHLARFFQILPALALVVAIHSSSQSYSRNRRTSVNRGAWSSEAVSLFNTWGGFDSNPGRKLSFASPDKEKVIEVQGETVSIVIKGKRYRTRFGQKTNAELGWSPDSQYFFLTWTDSGDTGGWHVELYGVTETGIREIPGFENRVRVDFERRIRRLPIPADLATPEGRRIWQQDEYCDSNIVANQWLNGSKELLVSALVPNVGICRYESRFEVYRVTVPDGSILQRYSEREAHQKFNPANLPIITNE